mgnify:CR=1 FL=1
MKSIRAFGRARPALVALSVVAAAALGCGGGVGSYCYEVQQCEGGNDRDEEACNANFNGLQDLAEVQNCGSEFDRWFDCIEERSRCDDDHYRVDEGACGSEQQQLFSCADLGGNF